MKFSHGERLALAKTFDQLILADNVIHNDEIDYLEILNKILDLDDIFLIKARDINDNLRIEILKAMSDNKKKYFLNLVIELAKSDGLVHMNEAEMINRLCESIGIYVEIE